MKRIAIIIIASLLLIFTTLWTIYTVRQNRIQEQYISNSTTSILSIAVDDLILDNMSSLFSWSAKSSDSTEKKTSIKKIIFNAGISIPARIYLFSVAEKKDQFYGILSIKDYDNCFSYFAEHYPEGLNFVNKEKGIVSVGINKYVKVLFDRKHLIYTVGAEQSNNFQYLQTLLGSPEQWKQIGSFAGFEHAITKKHISYVHKDKSLILEAMVAKNHTQIDGKWKLSQNLAEEFEVSSRDTTNQTALFWSLLPLRETPILSALMRKYTGLNDQMLDSSYGNYFDLQIKADYTIQRDTSISYVYDDNFNSIEEKQVKELSVPSITHIWKYNPALAVALPEKMFYQFHKKQIKNYLVNTTVSTFPEQVQSKKTPYPFYCFIDFGTWPDTWMELPVGKLKERKVKVTLKTIPESKSLLSLKGHISY